MVDRQNQPAAWRRALESRRVAKTYEVRQAARVTRACDRLATPWQHVREPMCPKLPAGVPKLGFCTPGDRARRIRPAVARRRAGSPTRQ